MEPRADQTAEILERLRTGAAGHACAGFLTTLDPLHLADLLTGLVYDRLRRKYDAAAEIYRISGQNWNQTFYTLLFRYIGDLSNQDTYTELARRATYTMVLRERHSLPRIEALLFGTSGLLDTFRPDDYIRRLRDDFAYFRARYDIEPIDPSAWKTANIRPGNLPRLRIAQLASFLSQHDFVFEQLLACRTRQEVNRRYHRPDLSTENLYRDRKDRRRTPSGSDSTKRMSSVSTWSASCNTFTAPTSRTKNSATGLSPCWNVFPPKRTNTRGRGSQPESIPATHSTRRG